MPRDARAFLVNTVDSKGERVVVFLEQNEKIGLTVGIRVEESDPLFRLAAIRNMTLVTAAASVVVGLLAAFWFFR